jgi:peptidoglycan/xylan/chitin deacetylase (PgdA/CDA1 family)
MTSGSTSKVLNLCFHGIGRPERALEPDEQRFWIEPDVFDEMLAVVAATPSVRITFDDGNASDVALALPALRGRGLRASFFVIGGRLGEPGSLSRSDVRELARNGMTIGSHGMRHRPWRSLDDEALREELVDAPRLIADAAGQAVHETSCPFGSYDRRVLRALRRHGFSHVYTVDDGTARADAWLQARYTVRDVDTPDRISALARGLRGRTRPDATRSLKRAVKAWR